MKGTEEDILLSGFSKIRKREENNKKEKRGAANSYDFLVKVERSGGETCRR